MKKGLLIMAAALTAAVAVSARGAPYEDQRIQAQRAQEARQHYEARDDMAGGGMHEHMELMREMHQQMDEARNVDRMSPEEMRVWIRRHSALMERMDREMMEEHEPRDDRLHR